MDRVLTSMPFLSTALARQGATLRAAVERASQEMATGRVADPGKAVSGDFTALAGIDHSLSRLEGFRAVTSEVRLQTETMQAALAVVADSANALAAGLMRGSSVVSQDQQTALYAEGRRHFDAAVAALNARFSERAVFGGTVSEGPPLPDAETILAGVEAAVAGATTADAAMTAITGWFNGASGYEALYQGGPPRTDLPVAPGEVASLPVTALDPAIRETLAGLAAVALMDRGLFNGNASARGALAKTAGDSLLTSGEARSVLAARVGTVEAQVADAETRNTAETSALSIARQRMLEADPYQTAAELQDLQTRLEAFYVITSRLARLSLTEYMR